MVALPNEILLEIVKYYPPITSFQDPDDILEEYNIVKNTLTSLCLVSKVWRNIAQPLLYRTYIKTEKTDPGIDHDEYNEAKIEAMEAQGMDIATIPEEEFEYTDYRKPIPLEMFIRTMIERPDLAEQVECLSISNYWDENADRGYGRTDVNKALGEAMLNASLKVPPQKTPWEWRYPSEWQEDWRNELREGDEVAEVALLMVLLPNIRFLDLGTSSETYGTYIQDLWRQLLGSQSKKTMELYGMEMEVHVDFLSQTETPLILSRLEAFNARTDNSTYENAPNIDIVEEVLTIPSLKNFYCWGLQQLWSENLCLPLAHLKEVYLDDCRVSEDALLCIIYSCKQLESLNVIFSEWSRWTDVRLGKPFLIALAQRNETLRRLTLLLPPFFKQRSHRLYVTAPFDLRRLTNLETLSIDYDIVSSERDSRPAEDDQHNPKFPRNLPKSIQQLNIEGCRLGKNMAECASYLISAKRKYNKLKFMRCGYETLEPTNNAEKRQIVSLSMTAGVFKALGMELEISSEDRIVGPHPAFGPNVHPQTSEDEWSDVSDPELGDWEDVESDMDIDVGDDVDDDVDDDDVIDDDIDDVEGVNGVDSSDANAGGVDDTNDGDEMDEDTHEGEQGRYDLRPR
jgi:hypothetical protein